MMMGVVNFVGNRSRIGLKDDIRPAIINNKIISLQNARASAEAGFRQKARGIEHPPRTEPEESRAMTPTAAPFKIG